MADLGQSVFFELCGIVVLDSGGALATEDLVSTGYRVLVIWGKPAFVWVTRHLYGVLLCFV